MTTTPLMGMVLPDDGASLNTWGIILNTIFSTRLDVHDHTTGLGTKVPVAGLNINADLSFSPSGTPRAITDLKAIDFAAVASSVVSSLAGAFFMSDGTGGLVANEVYYRTTGGSNVQVTSGAALNVAAFAGGIGGDYAAVGALLDYDDATDTYRFRQETAAAVRQFAKVRLADIQLIEYDPSGDASVPTAALTIKSPDALASPYDLTMFTALPGSTSLVQLSSTGQFTASNTVANAVTLSATLTAAAINASGLIGATTLTASGLVTANAGVTAGANQHVTVSGTGEYKHGDRVLNIPGAAVGPSTGVTITSVGTAQSAGAATFVVPIALHVGDRIKSVTFARFGDGAVDLTVDVVTHTAGAFGALSIGSNNVTNAAAAWVDTTVDCTDTTITSVLTTLLIVVANGALAGLDSIRVTYDHP